MSLINIQLEKWPLQGGHRVIQGGFGGGVHLCFNGYFIVAMIKELHDHLPRLVPESVLLPACVSNQDQHKCSGQYGCHLEDLDKSSTMKRMSLGSESQK